jgi:hypothetical protein
MAGRCGVSLSRGLAWCTVLATSARAGRAHGLATHLLPFVMNGHPL